MNEILTKTNKEQASGQVFTALDGYTRTARKYFMIFEGFQLFPRWTDVRWMGWIFSLAVLVLTFVFVIPKRTNVLVGRYHLLLVVAFELAFLGFSIALGMYKSTRRDEELSKRWGSLPSQAAYRQAVLSEIVGSTPNNFLNVVKNFQEFERLKAAYPVSLASAWSKSPKKIFDPDSKPRLLGISLAVVAACVSLFTKLGPELPISTLDPLFDADVWIFIGKLLILTIGAFVTFIGLQDMGQDIFQISILKAAASPWGKVFRKTQLRYLMADLIAYHEPEILAETRFQSPAKPDDIIN